MAPEPRSEDRTRACVEVVTSVVSQRGIDELCDDLASRLGAFVNISRLILLLVDSATGLIRIAGFVSNTPHRLAVGDTFRMDESPVSEVLRSQQPLHIPDVAHESRYPRLMDVLRAEGIGCLCYMPLTSPTQHLGALGFTSSATSFSTADLKLMEMATKPVAIAVENILNRERLERERDHLQIQLKVNNALVTHRDLPTLFRRVSEVMSEDVPHEFLALSIWNAPEGKLRFRMQANRNQPVFTLQDREVPLTGTPSGEAFTSEKPCLYNAAQVDAIQGEYGRNLREQGIRAMCAIPLRSARGPVGAISVGSTSADAYTSQRVETLQAIGHQLSIAVENALSFEKLADLNRRLHDTNVYLEEELVAATASTEILGRSPGIRRVLQQIETVAGTGATVLICGETGSGKELVARAIHQLSSRNKGSFVKLNCAAIPTGLLESELFGHERGAFTGAIAQKIGRFEIAHNGTLFLDEIGEIPLELQPKLLRVLQDKEFERLGSVRTIKSDARLVAATNRDLKKMAEEKQFRPDLFYRLNVFPITVPPLRERKEDIPLLALHFTHLFARSFGKKIHGIPAEAMERLVRYHWPGNIRELQNLIERAVILTPGETLRIPLAELDSGPSPAPAAPAPSGTLEGVERAAILRALNETNGMVGGPRGAAAKLGMKRTSLLYRMQKLGINHKAE